MRCERQLPSDGGVVETGGKQAQHLGFPPGQGWTGHRSLFTSEESKRLRAVAHHRAKDLLLEDTNLVGAFQDRRFEVVAAREFSDALLDGTRRSFPVQVTRAGDGGTGLKVTGPGGPLALSDKSNGRGSCELGGASGQSHGARTWRTSRARGQRGPTERPTVGRRPSARVPRRATISAPAQAIPSQRRRSCHWGVRGAERHTRFRAYAAGGRCVSAARSRGSVRRSPRADPWKT